MQIFTCSSPTRVVGYRLVQLAVLVFTGIELIFFLVAGIALCFGFSMRIMSITY